MPTPNAELSSLATGLNELIRRVAAIAERSAGEREDDLAAELFAVERALTGAARRLERLSTRSRR